MLNHLDAKVVIANIVDKFLVLKIGPKIIR